MNKIITILTVLLTINVYADKCDELKKETIYYMSSSTTSEKTNELLTSLSDCDFDKYDVALISYPAVFMQLMDNLIASKKDNINVGDLVISFINFKTNEPEIYKNYHFQIKQFVDYYSEEVTSSNLGSYINQLGEQNGEEIAIELKEYVIKNSLVNNQNSYKNVLNEFYSIKYDALVFNENINSISWKNTDLDDLGQEIDKSHYQDRINIASSRSDSAITLVIQLKDNWSIYSFESESNNMFKSIIASENDCLEILDGINIEDEIIMQDPMGINGNVRLITGKTSIFIPYQMNCDGPLKLALTFTLIKNDGSSLPFVKEIIEIK